MKYEKTSNPNIIKQTESVESEIHIDKLEKQITDLDTRITNIPKKIEYQSGVDVDTKKAIDFYNQMNTPTDKTGLEKQLKEKQNLLKKLKGL